MKKICSVILALLILAAFPLQAAAAHVSGTEAAETLSALGLLRGTAKGFELERSATRAEAAVMLLRLLGKEADAENETAACPFDDGGWASRQLTYAWKNGLVNGRSATHYGSADTVGSRDYVTMLLRALGYSEAEGDFTWRESLAFADGIGLCHGEYTADSAFLREDMVLLSRTALTLSVKGTDHTLAQKLYREGVVSGAALYATHLSHAVSSDRRELNAMEIHERCASAVALVELYENDEEWERDKPSGFGSAFFITADGVAAMTYHELDGREHARVTTLDGHRYEVTGVLAYDPLWDTAVVRVSRTDLDGNTVRYFPYLEFGNSDALCAGETVYTLSCALGLVDNITDGLLSNGRRNVDDPDYLSIQVSAPISPGSSGGALINRYGEVIGILYGSFINGENMNLATPINVISNVKLTGEGQSIHEVRVIEDTKKAAATLSVSQSDIDLTYGESVSVVVTHTAPATTSIRYKADVRGVVACEWFGFTSKHTVPLEITAIGDGEATITISFAESGFSDESDVKIHVTVTGTPEDVDPDLPSGTTSS